MKVIDPSFKIRYPINRQQAKEMVSTIADAARTCYKTEDTKSYVKDAALVRRLVNSGHEAMLEHGLISVKIICDRGVSHELVRHRMASFAQESQRYCNYTKGKFDGQVTFVRPTTMPRDGLVETLWMAAMGQAEYNYKRMVEYYEQPPEIARSVLPNATKTEIIVTANPREWRHILKLRSLGTTGKPHPDMKFIMDGIRAAFVELMPEIFEDLKEEEK